MGKLILFLGRVLYGAIFLGSGYNHLSQQEAMVGYAKSKGAPSPETSVPGTGVLMLVSTLGIVTGLFPRLGGLALAGFLGVTNYFMHPFWKVEDPQQKQMEMSQFLKNTSLIGGALIIAAIGKGSSKKDD